MIHFFVNLGEFLLGKTTAAHETVKWPKEIIKCNRIHEGKLTETVGPATEKERSTIFLYSEIMHDEPTAIRQVEATQAIVHGWRQSCQML